ncbi:GGDEF domain-containing protein [bacterium]|nr:GGDEF domain-containing protein [bacterium]
MSSLMIYFTFQLSSSFHTLTATSEQYVRLDKAAHELMDASDHLTEKVQRFVVHGDMQYLEEYFEEAFESKHREDAIVKMSKAPNCKAALEKLQIAMEHSIELMNLEYYAMRLAVDAKGYTKYPELLKSVKISAEDQALAPKDKMWRATELVLGDDYYRLKTQIRKNMQASLYELEQIENNTNGSALELLHRRIFFQFIAIAVQTVLIFLMVWLTSRIGIDPILDAVKNIRSDSPIPEVGANEFRYLARAYNKMYRLYRNSLKVLSFKASHDELTGAYNRSGYDMILSKIDLNSTCMILLDIDNFKSINDTYGHGVGDKILIKFAQILHNNFLNNSYVCRIGGDEFVVFIIDSDKIHHDQIASKIENINKELGKSEDGLPATSISVGIAHGKDASDVKDLFEKIDKAMYQSKQKGKRTHTFYSE